MNIILLNQHDWIDPHTARVDDHRAEHIRNVLKASPGDRLRVGVLHGLRGEGLVEAIDGQGVRLRVMASEPPPPRHGYDIVLALPRPKMLRRILRTVAEFGVAHLHLIHSARVEKSYWHTPLLQPAKIQEALLTGMERAMDTVPPQVQLHRRFRPFVEDELPGLCAGRPCWIAELTAKESLAEQPRGPAVVMIGPEGGFVPFERKLAEAVIAQPVHLGSRILSVDTALPAVLAQALPG